MACKSGNTLHLIADFKPGLISKRTGLKYKLDNERFVFNLLPPIYRKIRLFKYLTIPFIDLKGLFQSFIKFRRIQLLEQRVTASQIILEKYLNMLYETTDICIKSRVELTNPTYIFDESEWGEILPSKKEWIFDENEWGGLANDKKLYLDEGIDFVEDFKVEIPQAVLTTFNITVQDVRQVIDKFNIATITYQVIII